MIVGAILLLIALPRGFSAGSADPQGGGYYQRLADGFLHGELGIRDRPPQWLVHLDDPFDPPSNRQFVDRYGRWDATLSGDRLYYYWGPVPVIMFVVPLRIVGIHVTETDIGILAALVIVVFIGLLVRRIADRWPIPPWLEFFTALGLAAFFSGFHLLRYVAIWQATVLVAAAFGTIALYCFVCAALAPPGTRVVRHWLLGGIALALAVGTRPTYLMVCLVPVALLGVRFLKQRGDGVSARTMVRPLTLALAPTAVVMIIFLAYNQARFGSPTDFGLTRVMSPSYNLTKIKWSSLSYTLPNAYYYLVRPLSLAPVFPFLAWDSFQWPFHTPPDYAYNEPVVGILTTSPLLVLGVIIVARGSFARRVRRDARFIVAALLVVLALLAVLLIGTALYGATQRYRIEPDLFLTAAAAAAISLAWSFLRSDAARRAFLACVGVLSVFSVVLAILAAYPGHFPFTVPPNGFGRELASIGQPIEDAALSSSPYVLVEPSVGNTGPFTLGYGFLLFPEGRLHVYARGDCAVRMVLDRDLRDRLPITMTSDRPTRIRVSPRRVIIEIPPGDDHQVITLDTTRYDGWPFTAFLSGHSTYDCSG